MNHSSQHVRLASNTKAIQILLTRTMQDAMRKLQGQECPLPEKDNCVNQQDQLGQSHPHPTLVLHLEAENLAPTRRPSMPQLLKEKLYLLEALPQPHQQLRPLLCQNASAAAMPEPLSQLGHRPGRGNKPGRLVPLGRRTTGQDLTYKSHCEH